MRAIQTFEVSLKAFIVRGQTALFVREADSGFWELPGGRIDVGEEWDAHAQVLAREMREELGAGFAVTFGPEVVTWTRQRPSDGVFQFIVARVGQTSAGEPADGEPVLSAEHDAMGWFDLTAARGLRFPERSGYASGIDALWQLIGPGRGQS